MKKLMVTLILLLVAVPCVAGGDVVAIRIDRLQADGVTAVYDHESQTLTWTGGASVSLYTGIGDPAAVYNQGINIQATFTGLTDESAGGAAKASFAAIEWSVLVEGEKVIWGTQKDGELFVEEEQIAALPFPPFTVEDTGILFGSGVVRVVGSNFELLNPDFVWSDTNDDARLKSQISGLDYFDSYLTDDYSTLITTMWLFADETMVPEPATMLMLGLGSMLVLAMRKTA
ncbi:MAG TPA: PEP-CTERM sorting domain-containing protein [Anaerohalosphaeraceae bacterium]|nr:PEP-CTERM sorting domain-containing protein [Anaerohalosphaeraceae bacterium]HPB93765.1 PEP-CTERM sorting domain-containing protein [Anaerohalosphaeraceae bacterium]HRT24159.1 PEP-CTERM sorting domain-containing protein [Anaerohalosphaeraceae bacterium]HRU15814.1 PEP-CTERM sorting domain-containing protein [Anaerohalosphaeraceae bacterium]